MKSLIKDESGMGNSIDFLLSLSIIVITYALFMPLLTFITNVLINMGAPAENTLFFLKMARWGMYLFAAAVFIILLSKTYKSTHDTQKY
jgi:hypothetical protein